MNHALMERLESLGRPRILVVGDLILERDVIAKSERSRDEPGVVKLRSTRRVHGLGGAGRIAVLLHELGAEVRLIAGLGDDSDAEIARALCDESKIDDRLVVMLDDRPTSLRERFFVESKGKRAPELRFKVDHLISDPILAEAESYLWHHLAEAVAESDLVIISDHDCGVCAPSLLQSVITACRTLGVRVIADPGRSSDLAKFEGVSALVTNRLESQLATGSPIRKLEDAPRAGRQLIDTLKIECSIIALDQDGMAVVPAKGRASLIPGKGRATVDVESTSQATFAALGLCLAAGATYQESAEIAAMADGLLLDTQGIAPLSRDALVRELGRDPAKSRNKLFSLETLLAEVAQRRQAGQKIVFTNGSFDVIQSGQVRLLREAASLGDFLIVGVCSDQSPKTLKGPNRSMNPLSARAEFLEAIECVDAVMPFEGDSPLDLIKAIVPDILVDENDQALKDVVGRDVVERAGGRVVLIPRFEGPSATHIVHGEKHRTLTLHAPSVTAPGPMSRRSKKPSEKKPKS